MRTLSLTAATILCALSSSSRADFYTYSFGDLGSCKYGIITNETREDSDAYLHWKKKADALNTGLTLNRWSPFYISSQNSDFASLGICRTVYSLKGDPLAFECKDDSEGNFLLAGIAFKLFKNIDLPTYRCTEGCRKGIPKLLYDNGYEAGRNIELENFLKRFERACNKRK